MVQQRVLMFAKLHGQNCCLQASMGQRLELFTSHHFSYLLFTCCLVTANVKHPGASVPAKSKAAPSHPEDSFVLLRKKSQAGTIKPDQPH